MELKNVSSKRRRLYVQILIKFNSKIKTNKKNYISKLGRLYVNKSQRYIFFKFF